MAWDGNRFMLLLTIIDLVFRAIYLLLIVYSVMSWFSPYPRHAWQRVIVALVEPLLHPIRALLPRTAGMDFSPMIAALILYLLQSLIVRSLLH